MFRAVIQQTHTLSEPSSASGIEYVQGNYYVIGDDASALFVLDDAFKTLKTIPLLANKLVEQHIPKKQKPDFECLTWVMIEEVPHLLVLGSGAKELRKIALLVNLLTDEVTPLPYLNHYNTWEKDITFTLGAELNLEALASTETDIFLFQRGNVAEKNTFLRYSIADLKKDQFGYQVFSTILPTLKGGKAGFSGACYIFEWHKLLFTASVELTNNAIDDGEVAGSFVGILSPQGRVKAVTPVVDAQGQTYLGKIESISIKKIISKKELIAVAVTDPDGGTSQWLELKISL